MGSKVVLGYPYSGAMCAYFRQQLQDPAYQSWPVHHPYYRTLYGDHANDAIELALNFVLLHDEVWLAPADNHWPKSKKHPDVTGLVWELGLHSNWEDLHGGDFRETDSQVRDLVAQPIVQEVLVHRLKLSTDAHRLVVMYALCEAGISAQRRIPILCSPERRILIEALMQVQQPSLRPRFVSDKGVGFIERYREFFGLALAPANLDDLMDAKPDPSVRNYGQAFIDCANAAPEELAKTKAAFALHALDAMETRRVAGLFSGALNWASRFLRLAHQPLLAAGAATGSRLILSDADSAGWYEFAGAIDTAISKAQMIRALEQAAHADDA